MTILGAFGLDVRTFVFLHTIKGKDSIKKYLRSFYL
jgi:hypothetical protein